MHSKIYNNSMYIITVELDFNFLGMGILPGYVKKIVSYKRSKWKNTVDIDRAYKYKSESSAIKAAQFCKGSVHIV